MGRPWRSASRPGAGRSEADCLLDARVHRDQHGFEPQKWRGALQHILLALAPCHTSYIHGYHPHALWASHGAPTPWRSHSGASAPSHPWQAQRPPTEVDVNNASGRQRNIIGTQAQAAALQRRNAQAYGGSSAEAVGCEEGEGCLRESDSRWRWKGL